MAFLVWYSRTIEDHARDHQHRAAYLPQAFYELIYAVCRPSQRAFPVLSRIASLRYKSPRLLVADADLESLINELGRLPGSGDGGRDLLAAAEAAIARSCSLTISADMYPELDDGS